ncbi:MAG TPA: DUF975 family protein [Bacilli bacterium]|jgi:uncharacterized membrane protein|nr:DUF975 family protein [Bacilli bacterium]
MKAKDFRRIANEKANAQITNTVIVYLLFFALMGISTPTGIGAFILAGPATLGLTIFIIKLSKREKAEIEDVFKGFNNFVPALVLWILQQLFVFLWSLLFLIPGIIKHYAYALAFFLLEEKKELDPSEALRQSEAMMRGHKWRLFCLDVSYLGWIILSILTAGILFLWVKPKMDLAHYEFFLDLRERRKVEVVDIKEIR